MENTLIDFVPFQDPLDHYKATLLMGGVLNLGVIQKDTEKTVNVMAALMMVDSTRTVLQAVAIQKPGL